MRGGELRKLRGRRSRTGYAAALGVTPHSLSMWERGDWAIPDRISEIAYAVDACGEQPRRVSPSVADSSGVETHMPQAGSPAGVNGKRRTRRKK